MVCARPSHALSVACVGVRAVPRSCAVVVVADLAGFTAQCTRERVATRPGCRRSRAWKHTIVCACALVRGGGAYTYPSVPAVSSPHGLRRGLPDRRSASGGKSDRDPAGAGIRGTVGEAGLGRRWFCRSRVAVGRQTHQPRGLFVFGRVHRFMAQSFAYTPTITYTLLRSVAPHQHHHLFPFSVTSLPTTRRARTHTHCDGHPVS